MKRMIFTLIALIGLLLSIDFFRDDWSIWANEWLMTILISLLLLLGNELGLYFWRRKMPDLSKLIKNSQLRATHTEQENHYVPPTNSD